MNNETPIGALTQHNIISCIDNLSLQDYNDLTDCTRVATRSADMAHNRYSDSEVWLEEYLRTLMYLGWKLHQGTVTTRTTTVLEGSIADFLVLSAEKMNDVRQASAMMDTLDALKPDKPAVLSLDNESHRGRRFQVAPTRYDSNGDLHLAIFNIELVASVEQNSFLFWSWSKNSAKLIQRSAFLKLNRSELNAQRRQMEAALSKITASRFALRKSQQ